MHTYETEEVDSTHDVLQAFQIVLSHFWNTLSDLKNKGKQNTGITLSYTVVYSLLRNHSICGNIIY